MEGCFTSCHERGAAALLVSRASEADAQQRAAGGGLRITLPSHSNHFSWEGKHGFHGSLATSSSSSGSFDRLRMSGFYSRARGGARGAGKIGDTEYGCRHPWLPRKPYVIGGTYASLPPQGCMKLIEDGASYYFCSGEWYRQLGAGRGAKYRAVARP